MDRIAAKLRKLKALADRPGTPHEGAVARELYERLQQVATSPKPASPPPPMDAPVEDYDVRFRKQRYQTYRSAHPVPKYSAAFHEEFQNAYRDYERSRWGPFSSAASAHYSVSLLKRTAVYYFRVNGAGDKWWVYYD